jgi:N4-(beta-N-acetylglucosaminyl)-L-asparaginase
MWSVVSTWPFSLQLTQKAAEMLASGERALDALEAGVQLVESDPKVDSVGRGGFLNAKGELELDAAVMDGDSLRMGCVAGVRGFEHPVSIARKVMEETVHSILVGVGAEEFARKMGIPEVGNAYMVTEAARKAWEEKKQEGHDTIGAVALDTFGSMGVAMSTSGANMKVPGRVGDTPIIGSGFYVDSEVGGAAATGLGEDIMRTCLAFRAVELMRQGKSPKAAAEEVILTAHNSIKRHGIEPDNIAIVCMNAKGESGASCNHQGFWYSHAREGQVPELETVTPVIDNAINGAGALGFLESESGLV